MNAATSAKRPLRFAASLILCAHAPTSTPDFRVLLLKRNARGQFGSLTVFPGGEIDRHDSDPKWHSLQPPPNQIPPSINRIGPHVAIAALREAFEESGVLLNTFPSILAPSEIKSWRSRVHQDASQFIQLAERVSTESSKSTAAGMSKDSIVPLDRLVHWSHWITPEFEKSRFDAHFFMTVVNQEQLAAGEAQLAADGQETVQMQWLSPKEALDSFYRQDVSMLPPQFFILRELATMSFAQLSNAVNSAHRFQRTVTEILPELIAKSQDGHAVVALPGDEAHSSATDALKGRRNRVTL
eukprot:jgi/Hompol1/4978/HPOL_002315-RA